MVYLPEQVRKSRSFTQIIQKPHVNCSHVVVWDNFSIIGRESNHYLLETKENLLQEITPLLNPSKYSKELYLLQPSH